MAMSTLPQVQTSVYSLCRPQPYYTCDQYRGSLSKIVPFICIYVQRTNLPNSKKTRILNQYCGSYFEIIPFICI
jgi:hypothetical protein